ncbi:MAG: hypothetical protein JO295_13590 [Verrucomicrobia bacterium]|nr:hypothetical protein [Verrucomicrobiota bacterium]
MHCSIRLLSVIALPLVCCLRTCALAPVAENTVSASFTNNPTTGDQTVAVSDTIKFDTTRTRRTKFSK